MKIIFIFTLFLLLSPALVQQNDANAILRKVEQNMSSDNRVFESEMTIRGKRNSRTITSRSYSVGDKKSFTEYLS
ncbi:MAG TPA: hypothetical protein PLI34_15985, partial [Saprospiraceae bacterium]|nr:hypothetical protein [Saprospiraceae bacterium]